MTEPLGLESKSVRIVPYDARWADLYNEEAARIVGAVAAAGLPLIRIEHVGSTAVPGLSAKPVLDIAAGRDSAVPARVYVPVFEAVGYIYRGESGVPGRDFFRMGALRRIIFIWWSTMGSSGVAISAYATPCVRLRRCASNMQH
jgi:GrpB-like predicted nucleotidyltransferase (UPF0157 family)